MTICEHILPNHDQIYHLLLKCLWYFAYILMWIKYLCSVPITYVAY